MSIRLEQILCTMGWCLENLTETIGGGNWAGTNVGVVRLVVRIPQS